jgi:SulP family sulfate permease
VYLLYVCSRVAQGLVSAAWGGLFHASLGGSSFNIIGPTGALSGILSSNAVRYGPEILPFLAILSGVHLFSL